MNWSQTAVDYFQAHAIAPSVAAEVGVLERDGRLVYPYGAYERTRVLKGSAKTVQPSKRPLSLWWPAGRPAQAEGVLIAEGESDALAALTALRATNATPAAVVSILAGLQVVGVPGASYPDDRLASELAEVGASRVILASDADEAGDRFAERATRALSASGVAAIRLALPDGSDLADALAAAGDRRCDWLAGAIADAEAAVHERTRCLVDTDTTEKLTVRNADLSASQPPRWAWSERIVLSALNLIVGQEGAGKGTLACWIFAKLSRGKLPGNLEGSPASIGVIGDEDSWNDVWTPRLHAAGADLSRVFSIERGDGDLIELAADYARLAEIVTEHEIRLLYLDQLSDNLGASVDDWRGKQVRAALAPARHLARELGCAVLGSLHPNKSGATFRQLMSGTVAFNALSRSSLLLAEHPENPDRRVVTRAKGNLSAAPDAVEFSIDSFTFEANGHRFDVPQATDFDTSTLTVDDLLAKQAPAGDARTEARELLADRLADDQWHKASELIGECNERGVYKRAVQRAADDLEVEREKRDFPATTYWRQRRHRGDALTPVASVASVTSGDSAQIDRGDMNDRDDTSTSVTPAVASANGHEIDGLDPDVELARIASKFDKETRS